MFIYATIFIYVFVVGLIAKTYTITHCCYEYNHNRINLPFAILMIMLPVFFIGMRTNYIDTVAYMQGFAQVPTQLNEIIEEISNSKGPGWILIQWIIKKFITDSSNGFIFVIAIIQGAVLVRFFYRYSCDYSFSLLLFFLSCSFVNMMNGIRQFTALVLIIGFVDYLFERRYFHFILICLIACTIHLSAIIWIPIIFVVHGKLFNFKTIIVCCASFLLIIFLDRFTLVFEELMTDTIYSGYTAQFALDDGSSFIHTILAFVPVFLAFIGKDLLSNCDYKIKVMINISFVGCMVSLIANFTSGILVGRMPIYFTIFNYCLYPILFEYIFDKKSQVLISILCGLGYVMYAIYYMTHAWGALGMPYISDILGINTWN